MEEHKWQIRTQQLPNTTTITVNSKHSTVFKFLCNFGKLPIKFYNQISRKKSLN